MSAAYLVCARCRRVSLRKGCRRVTIRGRWRWACYGCSEHERRHAEWLTANPGAWPMEIAHFDAVLAQELGR